ncbi:MAG: phosphoribosylanthranilate isomerase [Lachnospiraceae bacterium]|nr:phosphoribosylanthranilate isomerase [Lachnospiraceae bacterium]
MKIKICGITTENEIQMLNTAGVDYAGFVIFEKSKRYITSTQASKLFGRLDGHIQRVAVTVSPNEALLEQIEEAGFDILQVHKELKQEILEKATKPIWLAVNAEDMEQALEKLEWTKQIEPQLAAKIEAFVLDAPAYGSGKTFNWRKSKRLKKAGTNSPPENGLGQKRMLILAGGLNPDNVAEGIECFLPDVVDVSSGVENDNGIGKSEAKIQAFVTAVRSVTTQ